MRANDSLIAFLLTAFFSSPAYSGFDRIEFEQQIRFEVQSGYWTSACAGNYSLRPLGWASYYLVTDEIKQVILDNQTEPFRALLPYGPAALFAGDNLLYSNVWVSPLANKGTYQRLLTEINDRERHVKTVCGFFTNRTGVTTFRERRPFIKEVL
jgi:hypothetical protein